MLILFFFYANRRQVSSQYVDSQTAFCSNPDCPAKGQTAKGNIRIHSRRDQRYKCRECGQTFTATKGTPFYRLRHHQEVVVQVVTLLAWGCPPQAVVAAFGLDERTVSDWQRRAAAQCQQVHEHLVERPRELGEVQADPPASQTARGYRLGRLSHADCHPPVAEAGWSTSSVMRGSSDGSSSEAAALVSACRYCWSLMGLRLTARRSSWSAGRRSRGWGAAGGAYKSGPGCATRKSSNATLSGAWSPSSGE